MYFYTTAPIALDFSNTTEIEPHIGAACSGQQIIRLIDIEKDDVNAQFTRNRTNFYATLSQEEFAFALGITGNIQLYSPTNYTFLYTNAPIFFDNKNSTVEVHPSIGGNALYGDKPFRLVLTKKDHYVVQYERYRLELYLCLQDIRG